SNRRNQARVKKKINTSLGFAPLVLVVVGISFPWWISLSFFTFWMTFFLLDIKSTVRFKEFIRYETNVMVRLFSRRFTPKQFLILQILFEIVIIFSGSIFSLRPDVSSAGIIALVFGIAHMTAWHSNKKFVVM